MHQATDIGTQLIRSTKLARNQLSVLFVPFFLKQRCFCIEQEQTCSLCLRKLFPPRNLSAFHACWNQLQSQNAATSIVTTRAFSRLVRAYVASFRSYMGASETRVNTVLVHSNAGLLLNLCVEWQGRDSCIHHGAGKSADQCCQVSFCTVVSNKVRRVAT